MAMPPRGWYDDGHGALRWWDGSQWTEHVAPSTPPSDASSGSAADASADDREREPESPEPGRVDDSAGIDGSPATRPHDEAFVGDDAASASASTAWTAPSASADGTPAGYGYGYGPAQPAHGSPSVATYLGTEDPGAVAMAAPPRKSRMWIVWLVLGLGLLGIVVAVAVLAVSLITGGFAGSAVAPQPESTASVESEEVESEEESSTATTEDEAAAVAAVEAYNQAWLNSDCDAYIALTTENFRTLVELTDCESFYTQSRDFAAATSDYQMTVRETAWVGDAIAVSTTESFVSPYDDEGNETAEPELYEDRWEYLVIDDAGVWKLDNWFMD